MVVMVAIVVMIYDLNDRSVDLFSQQKRTAIWKVVTSRSYLPVLEIFPKYILPKSWQSITNPYLFAKVTVPLDMWWCHCSFLPLCFVL